MPDTATMPEIDFAVGMPAPGQVPAVPSPPSLPAVETGTLLQVISRVASDPTSNIEKMERLIAMQERMEARQAQVAYDVAMADAQEAMRAISPDKDNNQTKSKYATYAALDHAVRPIYSRHGFALSFNTGDSPNQSEVRVLCTVSHRGGHRQDYKIDMPADGKGPQGAAVMTRTHATGAAASYGQRYLLKLIFNLAVGDIDDDGNGADGFGGDDDIERMAPPNAPRDANGKLLSNYSASKAQKAKEAADSWIELLNTAPNVEAAKEWRRTYSAVAPGKKKSPLRSLEDNSPGQYLRVKTCFENVTGEEF